MKNMLKKLFRNRFFQSTLIVFVIGFLATTAVYSATFTVTKTADTNDGVCNADCSLREAIVAANSAPTNDVIEFNIPATDPGCANGICVITLSGGSLFIATAGTAGTLKITNQAQNYVNNLTLLGNPIIEISGNNATRILDNYGDLTLEYLTIRNGSAGIAGGIFNDSTASLTILNCTIRNNQSNSQGGGILNNGQLLIKNSTISKNSSTNGNGGGIYNSASGTATLEHVTVSNQNSAVNGGGIYNAGGSVSIRWTVIADNTTTGNGPDYFGPFTSLGENVFSNTSGMTGTFAASDTLNQPALLAPLGFYGGLNWTKALLISSPAQNSAPTSNFAADQRGAPRTGTGTGPARDRGAYEINGRFRAVLPGGTLGVGYGPFTITPDSKGCTMIMNNPPPGLSLTQSGSAYFVSGTPSQTGFFFPSLTITCPGGNQITIPYQIFIAAPSAATVSITGTVFDPEGLGLSGAYVVLTNDQGESRAVQTDESGRYRFNGVEVGRVYTITVQSNRFTYETRVIYVIEDITGLDFYPLPEWNFAEFGSL